LDEINRASDEHAASLLTPMIERAPQIARRVARHRPFLTVDHLCAAIRAELVALDETDRIALFRSHPELAPSDPLTMTPESQAEQARLRLTAEDNADRARLAAMNARYADKFGFPFITALARHRDMTSVMAEFEARMSADREAEIDAAIEQVAAVSASRVAAALGGSGTPVPCHPAETI
jgi:OHCU decarboxylase